MALNEEEVPANNIGGGMIQGAGIGPQGEPGVKKKIKGFKEFTNAKSGRKS